MSLHTKASVQGAPIPGTANAASEDTTDARVDAVLDLVKLTNQGKLRWRRNGDPSLYTDEFEADLGDKLLRLTAVLPSSVFVPTRGLFDSMFHRDEGPRIKNRIYPYLRVYGKGDLLLSFPDIAPLRSLLNAVEAQLNEAEGNVLEEIRKAASVA